MKLKIFTTLMVLWSLTTLTAFAQATGDVRSVSAGSWSNAATWEVFNGTAWAAAASAPAGNENIGITHSITADASISISGNVKVEGSGQLAAAADMVITFAGGSTYDHARDGGSIPVATWGEGSTFLLTGVAGANPGNRNQSFWNITINVPNNGSNRDFGFSDVVIGGDIRVISTGTGTNRWQLTSGPSGSTRNITINGDVIVEGGNFAVQGTGNGDTHFNVAHHGNVIVNGGNFSLSRGGQGNTGTTTWTMHKGNATFYAGTSQSSNSAGTQMVFAGTAPQSFTVNEGYTVTGGGFNTVVATGAVLSLGNSIVGGAARFIVNDGAELQTAHAEGIAGNLQTTGTVNLGIGGSYTFNGGVPQVTSERMPTVVQNLNISNPTTVTLSQSTTVNGTLALNAGTFDNTIPYVLGPDGVVAQNGGKLLVEIVDVSTVVVRSAAEGNWSNAATWEVRSGDAWVAATSAPIGGEKITLGHNVTADAALSISGSVTVQDGGQLSVGADIVVTFVDGSVYDHARDGGSIPVAVWGEGSTVKLTGIAGTAPGNRNQSYFHLIIDTPGNSGNKDFGFNDITIGGNVTIENTGGSRWQLTSGGSGSVRTFSIMGDVIMNGGQFAVQGTGNGDTHFTVNHRGNVFVNSGNFSLARGSQGGTGTTTWNLIGGNLNLVAGTSQSSNSTGAQFVFAGTDGIQSLNLSGDYVVNGAGIKTSVSAGATVYLGASDVRGSGDFTVNNGATVLTSSPGGLAGNLTTTGTVSLSDAASYGFNGSEAQVTSALMPSTVLGLTIDNAAGVTLSQETTINGDLVLKSGVFDNTIPFTLGPIGRVVLEGGSLLVELIEGIEFKSGDYRSVTSGNWSSEATWEVYNGTTWEAATQVPTGAEFIYLSGSNNVSADGGVIITGKVLVVDTAQFSPGPGGSITFGNGSEYEHGRNGGSIPLATWGEGSTFHLTGVAGSNPGNRNQSFWNIIINTPENTGNRDFGFSNVTIGGDINVFSTGIGSNRWQLTSGSSGTTRNIKIMGDVIVHAGNFAVHGTGNGNTHFNVEHHGNVIVNGGNFSLARGSQGGTGTTTWTLKDGNITLNGGTTQNSNNAGAMWVFAGNSVQSFEINEAYTISGTAFNLEVEEGAVLNMSGSKLGGTGKFVLKSGAGLQSAHVDGIAGNIASTGAVSLSTEASYTFNGTAPQVTSLLMPVTVANLTIDNETRVVLTQETAINGVLTLAGGIFDNTIPFSIGPAGSVVMSGGRLLVEDVAYEVGDIRSVASGSWGDGATWQQFNGGGWTALTGAPEGNFKVFIVNAHEITVNANVTVTGRITVLNEAVLSVAEGSTLTFGNGAVYNHARNEGTLPTAVWSEGSTYLVTGTTTTAPANRNQNFWHIELNTPDLTSNVDLGLNGVTIGGNITIRSSGSGTSRWQLTTASFGETVEVTIMGNVDHRNGNFTVNGTGNGETQFIVHHYGNLTATLGNFSISRGSQGGTGTTHWYFYGDTFSKIASTAQNSNNLGAFWVFAGNDGVQRMDIRSTVTVQGRGLNMIIKEGAEVNMGNSQIRAEANFALEAGATIMTTSILGFEGNFTPTVNASLSQQASYGFVGNQFQETSFTMPQVVAGLIIDNPQGVALTRETTVNERLVLRRGVLDNTITLNLGPDAVIVQEGGSLLIDTSIDGIDEMPISFALGQNYPNPFNPSTTIRYDIPQDVHVTISIYDVTGRLVERLVDSRHAPGVYSKTWNAGQFASGIYLYQIRAGEFSATRRLMLVK
jgi:hypothetical protein